MIQLNLFGNRYSSIEELPNEILGEIIKRMIPIRSDALSASLEALQNFGQTSQRMYSVIRSDYVNELVIGAILNRHNELPKHLLHRLRVPSLRRYIRKNGLDQAFKWIPKMHSVLAESMRSAALVSQNKESGFVLSQSKNFLMQPNDFLLLFAPCFAPRNIQLIHPFGRMVISPKNRLDAGDFNIDILPIFDALVTRLNAVFLGVFRIKGSDAGVLELVEATSKCDYFEVKPSRQEGNQIRRILDSDIEQIGQEDYEGKKGGQALIFSDHFFIFSCYKLDQAFGHLSLQNRCTDDRLMHIIFEILDFESSVDAESSICEGNAREKWMEIYLRKTIADMLKAPSSKIRPPLFSKEIEDEEGLNPWAKGGYLLLERGRPSGL